MCIYTSRTFVYNLIAKDQAQKMLLHASQFFAEIKLLGKAPSKPCTATAR